jgi:glycosyltransferase involved in cell wall biosynthesis
MPASMTTPATSQWAAGWYVIRGVAPPDAASLELLLQPEGPERLQPDRLQLPPARAAATLTRVVLSKRAFREAMLAWAPDGHAPVELRRISRVEAAARMFATLIRTNVTRRGNIVDSCLDIMATMLREGVGRAGDLLLRYYEVAGRPDGGDGRRAGLIGADAGVPCRLRRRRMPGATLAARWEPTHDLRWNGTKHGATLWETTGEDPRFHLRSPWGWPLTMPAGWYVARGRIEACDGRVAAPSLYPDYGDGEAHEDMVLLPDPDDEGWIERTILLKYPVARLRLDPTTRQARFVLHGFDIERIGRFAALRSMLRGDAGDRASPSGDPPARRWLQFLRAVLAAGPKAAVDALRASYDARLRPHQVTYGDWVQRYDTLGRFELAGLRERARRIGAGPLISILLPVYETPERWLRRCLDSVLQQAYPHWELCIADDASPSPRVRRVLAEYERRDPRIRVSYRERNGHIVEASNSALAMARGEFVALLDHDDELRPHALLEMAEAIIAAPALELLYSDEDKLDEAGVRCQPYFKPDWNPDLLLSQNYLCHLAVVRTARVRAVGGFRAGFDGSQDHDLFLRCTAGLDPRLIHHVPKVLYHWRAVAGSTALERGAKDYAGAAGAHAVRDFLADAGAGADVEELPHGHYRVRWPVPEPAPKVSVIIPTRDREQLLRTCVKSVRERTRYPSVEIVVVDNQSTDPATLAYLDELRESGVRVLSYDAPFNYSALNNWAAAQCDGPLLCLLNNDIEVIGEEWLEEMAGHALRPGIGAVGAMLYYPDDTIQHAGVILGLGGVANHAYAGQPMGYPGHGARALVAQNLSAVTGACLVVRRELYAAMGGLDERLQVAFNDIDFCLRLGEAGYRNVWTPFARLYHHESASRGREDSPDKVRRFLDEVDFMERRWGSLLHRDPAYNPNLTLLGMSSELASPPRA